MKGQRNCFKRKSQFLGQSDLVSKYPKSNAYRAQLEPFLGSCIEIVAQDYTYQNNKHCDGKVCGVILLTNVTVVKVPAKVRDNPLPTIDHLWVVVDKNWEAPLDISGGLWLRGFIYEYEKKGEKNIGMQVVSTKAYNQK